MGDGTRSHAAGRVPRVLAFESHDGGSHRQVREQIQEHGSLDWRWVTRPGRAWSWRMRTGAPELVQAAGEQGLLSGEWVPDVIFATSLIGLGDLMAMLPANLRSRPSVLYMHENQLAYPVRTEYGGGGERDLQYPITNLLSLLAADLVLWNSCWNRDSFCDGIGDVLEYAPDGTLAGCVEEIRAKSRIAWPPVPDPCPEMGAGRVLHNAPVDGKGGGPVVVWPHRWEHDKGPDALLATAREMSLEHDLRWIILGQQFKDVPAAMGAFQDEFGDRIIHAGYADSREEYLSLLSQADWVLSTADHEFFGIAVVEAILCGCLPWLPGRLSYPELIPSEAEGISPSNPPADPSAMLEACRQHLEPAIAPRAVDRIEQEIVSLVQVMTGASPAHE